MHALHCFSLASGLKINVHKSHLLGVGIPNDTVAIVASDLGCSTMTTPFKYLGVMVGENMAKVSAWDDVVRKIKSRLSKWKIKTLSIGGRLTLLKSVLGATPIYWMSLFKVPNSVLASMEALRREFFNGAQSNEKKITWVNWPKVLSAKKHAIHGPSVQVRSPTPCSPWYSIVREIQNLKNKGVDLLSHCKKELVTSCTLNSGMIYGLEIKNFAAFFHSYLLWKRIRTVMSLQNSMVQLISRFDRWRWDLNGSGSFRVCDVRNLLDEFFLPKSVDRVDKFLPLLALYVHDDISHLLFRCPMASIFHRLISVLFVTVKPGK
ncbi:hypothetical protein Tco_0548936 [Tanacetum coccineum]